MVTPTLVKHLHFLPYRFGNTISNFGDTFGPGQPFGGTLVRVTDRILRMGTVNGVESFNEVY